MADNNNDNENTNVVGRVREEARPLGLGELHKSQLEAAVRVLETLEPVADEVKRINKTSPDRGEELDVNRSSRILFLWGEAGNGKTTVYTSLRKALSGLDQKVPDGDPHKEKLVTARDIIRRLNKRIVWLEPIDLEPMAGSANFLAAVMARLGHAVEEPSPESDVHRVPGILEPKSRYQEAVMSLQRLQTDLALSWDGNLPARAAQVEPDVYSVEVLRTGRARLSVNRRLQEVLLRFSKDVFPRNRLENPLFLLPIDDFYLHPETSIELLRLLRMISSPHLFILLMGDIDVIEQLFYQKSLGDLIKIAGEGAFQVDSHQRDLLQGRASALTASALRKLLPPTQRIEVAPMEISEALNFHPPTRAGKESQLKSLETVLESIKLERRSA